MAPPSASEITTAVRVYLANPHCAREGIIRVPGRLSQCQAVSRAPGTAVSPPSQTCYRSPSRHQASASVSLHWDGLLSQKLCLPSAVCQCFPELRREELGEMAGTEFPTTPSHQFGCCPCLPLRQCLCFLMGTRGRNTWVGQGRYMPRSIASWEGPKAVAMAPGEHGQLSPEGTCTGVSGRNLPSARPPRGWMWTGKTLEVWL